MEKRNKRLNVSADVCTHMKTTSWHRPSHPMHGKNNKKQNKKQKRLCPHCNQKDMGTIRKNILLAWHGHRPTSKERDCIDGAILRAKI
jgi:hypothetical protein